MGRHCLEEQCAVAEIDRRSERNGGVTRVQILVGLKRDSDKYEDLLNNITSLVLKVMHDSCATHTS